MKKIVFLLALVSIFSAAVYSQSKETMEKKDFVPYGGMRMSREAKEFSVLSISGTKSSNGEREMLEINVRLSNPVNPRSVRNDTVLINGEKCGSDVFFHFGRRGNTIRISVLDPKAREYSVEFLSLESFNGEPLDQKKYTVEME